VRGASKFSRRAFVVGVALMSGAGLTRCSLFVDTDGLNDGGDASTVTTDASTDVVISNDARTDGGNLGDGTIATEAGFPVCDATHAICDNFDDDVGVVTARWTDGTLYGGGVLEFVTDASVSAPMSMHSFAPPNGGGAGAALYKTFSQSVSRIHCEGQAIVRAGIPQVLSFELIGPDPTIQDYYMRINLGTSMAHTAQVTDFFDGGSIYSRSELPSLTADTWSAFTLDMIPNGTDETVVATVNGSSPVTQSFPAPAGSMLVKIILGEDYEQNGFDALYDNVLCDVTP
jgi:hypothetical protein